MRFGAARPAIPPGVPRTASGVTTEGAALPTSCVTMAAGLAARCSPARDQMVDDPRHRLVRLDTVHPQPMHGFRGEGGRGAADDRGQVDPVDDVLRDTEEVHLV